MDVCCNFADAEPGSNCRTSSESRGVLRCRARSRGDGCCDVGERPEQDQRIILRSNKATPLPKMRRFDIDGIDDEGTSANQAGRHYTALQRMLEQPSANSFADVIRICRQLA